MVRGSAVQPFGGFWMGSCSDNNVRVMQYGRYDVRDWYSKTGGSVGWPALAILGVAQVLYSGAASSQSTPADVLFRNGYVYTVNAQNGVQQSLAVRGGRIVFVGSDADSKAQVGPQTRVVDLEKKMLM